MPGLEAIAPPNNMRTAASPASSVGAPGAETLGAPHQKGGQRPGEGMGVFSGPAQTMSQQQVSESARAQIGLPASQPTDLTSNQRNTLTKMANEIGNIRSLATTTFTHMTSEITQLLRVRPREQAQPMIDEFGRRFASVMLTHSTLTRNLATNTLLALRELLAVTHDGDKLGWSANRVAARRDLTEQVRSLTHTLLSEFPKAKNLFKFGPDAYAFTPMPTLDVVALEKAVQQAEVLHHTLCSNETLLAEDPNDPVFAKIKGSISAIGDSFGVSEIADTASDASNPEDEAIMPHMILAKQFTETALQGMGTSLTYQDMLRAYASGFASGGEHGLSPAVDVVHGHGDISISLWKSIIRTYQLEDSAERRIAGVMAIYKAVYAHVKATDSGNTALLEAFERNPYGPLHLELEPEHGAVTHKTFEALVRRTHGLGLRLIDIASIHFRQDLTAFYRKLSPPKSKAPSNGANTGDDTGVAASAGNMDHRSRL